jgi:hypothetical protein
MAVILLTDYPGGTAKAISFETHGKIDAGMSGMVGMMPTLLGFTDQKKSIFFRVQGLSIKATASMTDFRAIPGSPLRRAASMKY